MQNIIVKFNTNYCGKLKKKTQKKTTNKQKTSWIRMSDFRDIGKL